MSFFCRKFILNNHTFHANETDRSLTVLNLKSQSINNKILLQTIRW